MEFKQLKSFTAVVDYGNFTKAAEKTYTSQPTISTHIKALEEELDTSLITRDTKNMEVTAKGKDLYQYAIQILAMQEKLMRKWAEEDGNVIHLGASSMPSAYILPEILGGFRREHPEIKLVINQGDTRQIYADLDGGRCDVAFTGDDCAGPGIICEAIMDDRTVLISPNNERFARLARQAEVSPEELLSGPVIFREYGSASQKNAEDILDALGIDKEKLDVVAMINDPETIKNLVENGFGVSLMSRLASKGKVDGGKLLAFDLAVPQADRSFYLARRKDGGGSAGVQALVKYIKNRL